MKNRNKKIFMVLLGIGVILAIYAVIFYWENREIKGSPDDYVINGTMIENQRAGLKIQAPEGWDIERIELLEGSVVMKSQDIEGKIYKGEVEPPLTKGCGIETAITYKKMNFEEIKIEVDRIHFGLGIISEEFEEIQINHKTALKNTFDSDVLGSSMSVYIPVKNKLYVFGVYWGPDDKQRCIKEFEEMLDRVEIE